MQESGALADVVASHLPVPTSATQGILEQLDVRSRLRKGCSIEEALKPGRMARSDKGVSNPRRGYRENQTYS